MDGEQVLYGKVRRALCGFFKSDCDLLEIGANERSITHKFAEHLQRQFRHLKVDCEYNRHGDDIKKLPLPVENIKNSDLEAKTVYPDIIVHRRGDDKCNLLVIEAKKTAMGDMERDRCKLRAFTHPRGRYKYKCGLLLVFDTAKRKAFRVECFKKGRKRNDTIWDCLQGFPFDE